MFLRFYNDSLQSLGGYGTSGCFSFCSFRRYLLATRLTMRKTGFALDLIPFSWYANNWFPLPGHSVFSTFRYSSTDTDDWSMVHCP